MKVLSVTSEIAPLIKTGGLADVAGALPVALGEYGVDMRTLVPGYRSVTGALTEAATVHNWDELYGGPARLLQALIEGLDVYVLEADHLFDRDGTPYADISGRDFPDNWRRFTAFCRAAARVAENGVVDFCPDIVHSHDWQAGLVPAYIAHSDNAARPKTVMTVHNLAFQGQFPSMYFADIGLPESAFDVEGIEYFGGVGMLKAGLYYADHITTVSPTYAREIITPELGMGLNGLLGDRQGQFTGIVNGIDMDIWNPETDPHIVRTYSSKSLSRRKKNRRALEKRFQLERDESPLMIVVSRLTGQKGLDVLAECIDGIVDLGFKLAVLGTGEPQIETAFLNATRRHSGRVGVVTGYDEPLSHLMQAGGDVIIIPSRFEPCGLTQLYGLRYGCVPVVARTGGLADTVIDANYAALKSGVATGFVFTPVTPEALVGRLAEVADQYREQDEWRNLQINGTREDVSWSRSGAQYFLLYKNLISG